MARSSSDPKQPDERVRMRDFGGYYPNADPHDIPPGVSVEQVNVTAGRAGELRVRLGTAVVKFQA